MYVLAYMRIALRALRVSKLHSALTMQGKLGQADEQAVEISTLLQERRTVIQADLQALVAGRRQLRRLMEQPGSDRAAIRAGATQVKNIRGTLRDQRLATQLVVRSMLTPGQWARWLEVRTTRTLCWMRRGRGPVAAGSPLGITEHILITQ